MVWPKSRAARGVHLDHAMSARGHLWIRLIAIAVIGVVAWLPRSAPSARDAVRDVPAAVTPARVAPVKAVSVEKDKKKLVALPPTALNDVR